jgi:decaprenylphospho-beta-D-ribofuranose 2-oxidase
MLISGWGNNSTISTKAFYPENNKEIIDIFLDKKTSGIITHALGRSYGDCSIYKNIISLKNYPKFQKLDEKNGILECSANISLSEIISLVVSKGWFLSVTPGSKFVTVGGAIASDVHGKNHHNDGSFSDYVESFKIITAEGNTVECSKEKNKDLFKATCGGMGLTGIIVEARIKLLLIKSKNIDVQSHNTKNISETIKKFKELSGNKYLIAWVDSTSKNNLGRSIIFSGNHSVDKDLSFSNKNNFAFPLIFKNLIINKYFLNFFNMFYYNFYKNKKNFKQNLNSFFYPLDIISNWNKLYGKNGFIQIQLLIGNIDNADKIIYKILNFFNKKKQFSYLNTLKEFGPGNENFLSFPKNGLTLAMDIKMNKNLFYIYQEFEELIKDDDVKFYLTKDSLMSKNFFKKSYIELNKFKEIKKKNDPFNLIKSNLSERLDI